MCISTSTLYSIGLCLFCDNITQIVLPWLCSLIQIQALLFLFETAYTTQSL